MSFLRTALLSGGIALSGTVSSSEPLAPELHDVCQRYRDCRGLTEGEKNLARSFYGPALNYDAVRIVNGRYLGLFPIGNYSGMSPDGNIYVVKANIQSGDYSREREKAHFFIHEFFHIKQRHEGQNMLRQAFSLHAMSKGSPYAYKLEAGKPFSRYNFEQQAKMAEHAYVFGEYLNSGKRRYKALSEAGPAEKICRSWRNLTSLLKEADVSTGAVPKLCR